MIGHPAARSIGRHPFERDAAASGCREAPYAVNRDMMRHDATSRSRGDIRRMDAHQVRILRILSEFDSVARATRATLSTSGPGWRGEMRSGSNGPRGRTERDESNAAAAMTAGERSPCRRYA
jgi:hypothetical protein